MLPPPMKAMRVMDLLLGRTKARQRADRRQYTRSLPRHGGGGYPRRARGTWHSGPAATMVVIRCRFAVPLAASPVRYEDPGEYDGHRRTACLLGEEQGIRPPPLRRPAADDPRGWR